VLSAEQYSALLESMTPHGVSTSPSYRAMCGATNCWPICLKSLFHMSTSALYAPASFWLDAAMSARVTSIVGFLVGLAAPAAAIGASMAAAKTAAAATRARNELANIMAITSAG
jgi:hypothetical protein